MIDSVTFSIKGREYPLKYPNVGEYASIEAIKQALSKGYYSSLIETKTLAAVNALDIIDIQATLMVLCPQLMKDLNVKSFEELGILDFKEIKKEFINSVSPFMREIEGLLKVDPSE